MDRQSRSPPHDPADPPGDARLTSPLAHLLRLGLQCVYRRQLTIRPAVAIPRLTLPFRGPTPQAVIAQQPKRRAKIVVGRVVETTAGAHHDPARLEGLGHVQLRRRGGITRISMLTDDVTVFGGQNRQRASDLVANQLVVTLVRTPTGGIVKHGRARIGIPPAFVVHSFQAPATPGIAPPPFLRQTIIEVDRIRRALLVAGIVRIIQGMIHAVVVNCLPHRLRKEIPASQAADLTHQIPFGAGCQGGHGWIAAELEDGLHIDDGVPRDSSHRIRRHLAALPFRAQVRFVIELEIAHPGCHKVAHSRQQLLVQHPRIGLRSINAENGHDVVFQQQRREFHRAVMVGDLDPLDAHRNQLRQPILPDLSYAHDSRVAGVPMNADAGVIFGTRIIAQFHRSLRCKPTPLLAAPSLTAPL